MVGLIIAFIIFIIVLVMVLKNRKKNTGKVEDVVYQNRPVETDSRTKQEKVEKEQQKGEN